MSPRKNKPSVQRLPRSVEIALAQYQAGIRAAESVQAVALAEGVHPEAIKKLLAMESEREAHFDKGLISKETELP